MNAPADDHILRDLATALEKATSAGNLVWEVTANEDAFRALFKDGLVRIEKAWILPGTNRAPVPREFELPPSDGVEIYQMIVLNDRNREVSRYLPEKNPGAELLARLWDNARQSALSGNHVIQGILAEVSEHGQKR